MKSILFYLSVVIITAVFAAVIIEDKTDRSSVSLVLTHLELRVRGLFNPRARILNDKLYRLETLQVELEVAASGSMLQQIAALPSVHEANKLMQEIDLLLIELGYKH